MKKVVRKEKNNMNKGYRFDLRGVYVRGELSKLLKKEKVNVQNFVDMICAMGIIWSKKKEPLGPIQEMEYKINNKKYEIKVISKTRVGQAITSDNNSVYVGLKEDFPSYIYAIASVMSLEEGLVQDE